MNAETANLETNCNRKRRRISKKRKQCMFTSHARTCAPAYIYAHAYIHIYTYVHARAHVHIYTRMRTRTHTRFSYVAALEQLKKNLQDAQAAYDKCVRVHMHTRTNTRTHARARM